ncbi:hypothetical protein MKK69_12945 [Methylobacterium sp. J-026]|uniref:hypothetical protein n=1 Tax=Methylobacterium sp. J-026 TaxID=2836624 RepID=UPI001FB92983|nr:hypothetical protein [Methylobacterium sp. J-026]MCJ2134958.1 hypothetical protein [Methylobacterium sp. J-026]
MNTTGMMGECDKKSGRDIRLPSGEQAAATREHERTLRTLKRLADVLGSPIEDFFKPDADGDPARSKVDEEERK